MSDFSPGRTLYHYLAQQDDLSKVDLIMGFGNFDPRVPCHCVDLWKKELGKHILFTGGRGSGTGDVEGPEACWYRQLVVEYDPLFSVDQLLLETQSTNTPENVLFSQKILAQRDPPLRFGQEIRSLIFTTTAYRQRRVGLTIKKYCPTIKIESSPPQVNFENDQQFFAGKGYDFKKILVGEIDRIIRYGSVGQIEREEPPPQIMDAYRQLGGKLYHEGTGS